MSATRRVLRKSVDAWFHEKVGSLLSAEGFELRSSDVERAEPLQFFRLRRTRIEVVGCYWYQRIGYPESELSAETGVFLRSVPAPNDADNTGVDGMPVRGAVDCHFRRHLRPSWLRFPTWPRPGNWVVREPGPRLDRCLADMYQKIHASLSWFERFDDIARVYGVIVEKKKVGIRLPGSWGVIQGGPLVRGFLALECGEWADAVESLAAVLAKGNPGHTLDPNEPKYLYQRNRSRIEAALRQAEFQLSQAGRPGHL